MLQEGTGAMRWKSSGAVHTCTSSGPEQLNSLSERSRFFRCDFVLWMANVLLTALARTRLRSWPVLW
eukprot:scaffold49825_cov64-Phaeocystis_antarctica.AAC.3